MLRRGVSMLFSQWRKSRFARAKNASKRFKTMCCCCCYLELVQPENGRTLLDAFHWMIKPPQISENESLFLAENRQKVCKIIFLPTSQFWDGHSKIAARPKNALHFCISFFWIFFCNPKFWYMNCALTVYPTCPNQSSGFARCLGEKLQHWYFPLFFIFFCGIFSGCTRA